ncbi:MAG TPA: PAS domain-containing protein, partial [Flavisolibacter sp.]
RPSLGNEGKHPRALGQRAVECWPEIWEIIYPLIHQVRTTGEATWSEDQLVPIYRNGKIEDVYWTFGYSPIRGESDRIEGVLVVCQETTAKVLAAKKLERNVNNLHSIILQAPVAMCILKGPEFVVEIANQRMFELWGKPAAEILYRPLFEGLPEAGGQGYEGMLQNVFTTGRAYTANGLPVNLPRNGTIETVYVNFVYEPHREEDGIISGVMAVASEVTEQVLARKTIEESEQRVRRMVTDAPFPIALYIGREMRIAMANQAILDAWGKGEDVIGKLYSEVLPELEHQDIYREMEMVYATGIPFHAKNRKMELVVNGITRTYFFNYSFTPLFDASGKTYGIMNTAADVTDLNVAKQKIEESEARFRLLADSMPQFVWAADSEGNINYFNKAVYRFSGLTEDDVMGGGWIGIVHPDEREENVRRWQHAVATGEDFHFHHRFRNREGAYRWQLSRAIAQKDNDNNIRMWIGTSTDIHDQKLFEEALSRQVQERTRELEQSREQIQRSAERLAAVFNNAQSGMFTFSPVYDEHGEIIDFTFVITNPTFAAYVRQTPETLNGSLGSTWFPGYKQNGLFDIYRNTFLTGRSERLDFHYNVDGHNLYLDLMTTRVGDEVLITFTDYTPLKMAHAQLQRYVDELKRSNANLEEFAYAASHDMKEPIRKIHYFANRIKSSISDRFTEEEARYFERMEAAARRMGLLIDDLLSYSQVSVKPAMLEQVDLNGVLEQVLNDLEIEISEKGARIIAEKLLTIKAHPRQIQQAFQNLVSNALKFQEPGHPPVIEITSRMVAGRDTAFRLSPDEQQQEFYLVEVRDNGIGFNPEDAQRIFNVFTRLHGNSEFAGTGVGLSIARKVMENHYGYIRAESQEGVGSLFQLLFPAAVTAAAIGAEEEG